MSGRNKTRVTRSMGSHDRKLAYRALLQDLSTLEVDDDNLQQMEQTARVLHEAKSLLADGVIEERAKHPGEGYLDSRVLRATSDLAVRCSEHVTGNVNTYDKHELAVHIRENPELWQWTFPKEVPGTLSLFGTFAPTPLEQRPRVTRRRVETQRQGALTAPEAVDRIEKSEAGSKMVARVHKFISQQYTRNNRPLSYFHLVIDPTSFARTVENVYNVAFLVKDGMVAVDLDEEDGLPFIKPIPQQSTQDRDIAEENQFIVSLDMKRWKELIEAFNITETMMVLKRH